MFLKIVNVASIIIPVITRPTTDITITSGTGIFNIIKFNVLIFYKKYKKYHLYYKLL